MNDFSGCRVMWTQKYNAYTHTLEKKYQGKWKTQSDRHCLETHQKTGGKKALRTYNMRRKGGRMFYITEMEKKSSFTLSSKSKIKSIIFGSKMSFQGIEHSNSRSVCRIILGLICDLCKERSLK